MTDNRTTELLPCPFSGNCIWEPFSVKWTNCLGDVSYSATVICEACNRGIKCEIRTESAGYKTPEEAKAAIVAILNSRSYDKEAKEMTDNRTTELLPCPFCGSEARMLGTEHQWFNPACSNPNCGCEWTDSYTTEAEAIAAWNTRVDKTCEMVTSGTACKGNTDKRCTSYGAYGIGEHYDGDEHIATPKFCPECGKAVER